MNDECVVASFAKQSVDWEFRGTKEKERVWCFFLHESSTFTTQIACATARAKAARGRSSQGRICCSFLTIHLFCKYELQFL